MPSTGIYRYVSICAIPGIERCVLNLETKCIVEGDTNCDAWCGIWVAIEQLDVKEKSCTLLYYIYMYIMNHNSDIERLTKDSNSILRIPAFPRHVLLSLCRRIFDSGARLDSTSLKHALSCPFLIMTPRPYSIVRIVQPENTFDLYQHLLKAKARSL